MLGKKTYIFDKGISYQLYWWVACVADSKLGCVVHGVMRTTTV
jgi:hypothetical protein